MTQTREGTVLTRTGDAPELVLSASPMATDHKRKSASRGKPGMSLEQVREKYGEWTAMSIHLGSGVHTLQPAPDARLRRIVQVACDLARKPLSQLRVLDLACLEGHYAIEFAMHGAEVVGIELREQNLTKAQFVKDHLGLDRLSLYRDDVRNLSPEKYGLFDIVICSGILYHLDAPDVFHFVKRIYDVCTHFAIIDTQIACVPSKPSNLRIRSTTAFGISNTHLMPIRRLASRALGVC